MAAKTLTVKPAGQGGDYTTPADALAYMLANYPNLTVDNGTGGPGALNIEIGGTWSAVDGTGNITIDGFTLSAACCINIYAVSPARHAGVYSTSKYILQGINGGSLWLKDTYINVDGIIIDISNQTVARQMLYSNNSSGVLNLSNIILKGNVVPSGANESDYILQTGACTINAWNIIAYGMGTEPDLGAGVVSTAGTLNLYDSVIIGGYRAVSVWGGTINCKNVYGGGSNGAAEDFYRNTGTLAKTNCASADASADDTGTGETASNCIINKAKDTDTFVNVTASSEDFHLAADGLSPLQGVGYDHSGDSAPLNFTTDIDGDTITNHSIGADEYVAAGGISVPLIGVSG